MIYALVEMAHIILLCLRYVVRNLQSLHITSDSRRHISVSSDELSSPPISSRRRFAAATTIASAYLPSPTRYSRRRQARPLVAKYVTYAPVGNLVDLGFTTAARLRGGSLRAVLGRPLAMSGRYIVRASMDMLHNVKDCIDAFSDIQDDFGHCR